MEKNFLLILFYSASGSVKNLAHAIADGVEETESQKYQQKMKKLKLLFLILEKYIVIKKIL